MNGVLSVSRTVSRDYLAWGLINTAIYERYISGWLVTTAQEWLLVRQLGQLLYTVRNNLFPDGKRYDDANDLEVVERALPLLLLIVTAFTH